MDSFLRMISVSSIVLAQTPAPGGAPKPAAPDTGMGMLVWMMFAFVLIYFLTIRPQRKKQLELEAQIKSLKNGDKVVTSGGIHGTIANVRAENSPTLVLRIGDNIKIDVEKSAIARVLKEKTAEA
jgi:preprotein translocase subunit YajC